MEKLEALEVAGVDNWEWYDKSIIDYKQMNKIDEYQDLTDAELLQALEFGGVDNWEGYDYAMEFLEGDDDYE